MYCMTEANYNKHNIIETGYNVQAVERINWWQNKSTEIHSIGFKETNSTCNISKIVQDKLKLPRIFG